MAQPSVVYLDPTDRVDYAWSEVRRLRSLRREIEDDLIAAEAVLDAERHRETPGQSRDPLMSLKDAAKRLGCSESKLAKAMKAGRLEFSKLGRLTRVSEAQLAAYLEGEA